MGILVGVALLLLSGWLLFATFRRLRFHHAGSVWWLVSCTLAALGIVTGYWMTFHFEYYLTPNFRIFGAPFPFAVFHLEYGHWVDFVPPHPIACLNVVTNIALAAACAVLPVLVASRFYHRSEKSSRAWAEQSSGDN